MADEPVSAYSDPPILRLGRVLNRHKTIAYSGAVALVLLMVGTIAGSMLWSYQNAQRLAVERQKSVKETQLQAARQQRLTELRTATESASTLAAEEIHASRFSSALIILDGALESIREQPLEMWFRNARTLGVLEGTIGV